MSTLDLNRPRHATKVADTLSPATLSPATLSPSTLSPATLSRAGNQVWGAKTVVARFTATTPWSSQRPGALVVCCSDGRWHTQVEEFIRTFVSDRPDLYVVPGGPAGLCVWSSSFDEAHVAERSFRFLAEQHQLQSVWLIVHEDCAYYRTKYHPHNQDFIVRRQLEDVKRAADTIGHWYPQIEVHQVFAQRQDDRVVFSTH